MLYMPRILMYGTCMRNLDINMEGGTCDKEGEN